MNDKDEIKRLRKAIERMGNEADEISLLREITDNGVRRQIRGIGLFACHTLTAARKSFDEEEESEDRA